MVERILIDAVHPEEVRVVIANNSRLEEFDFETSEKKQIKGNIYLGKVTRVEPSLQAAFVEYGGNKQGFLPFSEIHYDYYQIPVADKQALVAAMEAEANGESIIDDIDPEDMGDVDPIAETAADDDDKKSSDRKRKPAGRKKESADEALDATNSDEELSDVEDEEEPLLSEEEGAVVPDADDVISKKPDLTRRYKIQEVIKRNQIVLVQVIKEERGNKGASLTTYLSLAGRYCVLMPNTDRAGGVSRRIADIDERKRLKEVVSEFDSPTGASVIVRTAGIGQDKDEVKRDYQRLLELWGEIRQHTMDSQAPALIHEEGGLVKRFLRDMYRNTMSEIIVQGSDGYKSAHKFIKTIAPDHIKKVQEYTDSLPIFKKYKIDAQLEELYEHSANLKSGGSIVIHQTEALVAIDVNSGKATRERSIEETALKTNLEAAEEVARQLRLRDLAGLVVIDFIDMRELRNRRTVERALKDALKSDRARIQVGRISMFGLMEMSRQRMRSSIVEASTITCGHCSGTGVIRSPESVSLTILRDIENEASVQSNSHKEPREIRLSAAPDIALYVLNHKRDDIKKIESEYGVVVLIAADYGMTGNEYSLDRSKSSRRKRNENKRNSGTENNNRRNRKKHSDSQNTASEENTEQTLAEQDSEEKPSRRNNKKSQSRRRGNKHDEEINGNVDPAQEPVVSGNTLEQPASDVMGSAEKNSPKGRRTNRTRKANPPADDRAPSAEPANDGLDGVTDVSVLKGLWKKITN